MTLKDMIQVAFFDGFSVLTFGQSLLILLTALVCATLICLVYRMTYHGALFSRSFCAALFAMTLITASLIMSVHTNITLSIGTLGALSIVRFRTAVKEPMDMAFMFFALGTGIICGANLLGFALLAVIFIGLILFCIGLLPSVRGTYIVVVSCDLEAEEAVRSTIASATRTSRLKSKSVLSGGVEFSFEVCLSAAGDAFVSELAKADGVHTATIVKSNGEYI